MLNQNLKPVTCYLSIFGILQFFILTSIAAYIYPGGYSYFGYYFSDLGTTFAKNGEKNNLAASLFILALMINAIAYIPFWYSLQHLFFKREEKYAKWGSIFGYFSAPVSFLIGLFPMDTQAQFHIFLAVLLFLLIALAVLFYSIAAYYSQNYSNKFIFVAPLLFLVMIVFILDPNMSIGPLFQKIAIYAFMIWILVQTINIWKFKN